MGRQQQARAPLVIADAEGVHHREKVTVKRDWSLRWVVSWWDDVSLDLTWPWLICAELAWLMLCFAVATQPFTRSLHWFWYAVLFVIQAYALQRLAAYVRESEPTPPTEVQPLYGEDIDE